MQIGQPTYNLDKSKIESVVTLPSRIVTKTVVIPALSTTFNNLTFSMGGMEDNYPKYIKIKNVIVSSFSSDADPQYYEIRLPGVCNFTLFIVGAGTDRKSSFSITGLAGSDYFFSNYNSVPDLQNISVSASNGTFFVNVFLTFEFYY